MREKLNDKEKIERLKAFSTQVNKDKDSYTIDEYVKIMRGIQYMYQCVLQGRPINIPKKPEYFLYT